MAAADWRALPVPLVDPADPAAAALGGLHQLDGAASLRFLRSALDEHRIEPTAEVRRHWTDEQWLDHQANPNPFAF